MTLSPGARLGPYEILDSLGAGGMGEVYRARDTRLGREVALKVLPEAVADDADRVRRFEQEARAAAALEHPGILAVHDVGSADGFRYLVSELLHGETLRQRLRDGPLPVRKAIDVATQIADALAAAHAQNIFHRDLKPENIFLTSDGRVKILDFGIARLEPPVAGPDGAELPTLSAATEPGTLLGTVGYMAPEQVRGQVADERSDLFALGCVLYEMLAGRRAFHGDTAADTMTAILREEPPPLAEAAPNVPTPLARIVDHCLEKRPEDRFQGCRDLAFALHEAAPLPSTRVGGAGSVAGATWRRTPVRRAVFVAGFLLVLLGIAALTTLLLREERTGESAEGEPREVVTSPHSEKFALAVLPFHIIAGEEEIGFMSLGLPDAIITRLATLREVRVRPTSAVTRFRSREIDPTEAGRVLESEHVVTGAILGVGGRLRVTVQLVAVEDGVSVWGSTYDLPRAELLALQDEIAAQVVAALEVPISQMERERLYRTYTKNEKAFELYMEGRSRLAHHTPEATLEAVSAFESALEEDPRYALARAGLAMAAAEMRLRFASEAEADKWGAIAEREAQRALDIEPALAEAHLARAAIFRKAEFDWERTIEESDRALALNPSLALPHYFRAAAFYHLGLLELVEAEVEAGLAKDPTDRVEPARTRGATAFFSGRWDEAIQHLEEVQRLSDKPLSDHLLAQALYYSGDETSAIVMLQELTAAQSASAANRSRATLASILAARVERQRAEELLQQVRASGYMDHHVAYSLGVAHGRLGDQHEAVRWLREAMETGFPCYPWYARDPLLAPLRSSSELRRLLADLERSWRAAAVAARWQPITFLQ